MRDDLILEETSGAVIGAFYEVFNQLRPGFLEAVYANALALELRARGRLVTRESPITVRYKGEAVGFYRADLLVDEQVIVEVKASKSLDPSASAQLLNYLRGTELPLGLLLHFGTEAQFHRIASSRARGVVRNGRRREGESA